MWGLAHKPIETFIRLAMGFGACFSCSGQQVQGPTL
jgi:hypothetical protein